MQLHIAPGNGGRLGHDVAELLLAVEGGIEREGTLAEGNALARQLLQRRQVADAGVEGSLREVRLPGRSLEEVRHPVVRHLLHVASQGKRIETTISMEREVGRGESQVSLLALRFAEELYVGDGVGRVAPIGDDVWDAERTPHVVGGIALEVYAHLGRKSVYLGRTEKMCSL